MYKEDITVDSEKVLTQGTHDWCLIINIHYGVVNVCHLSVKYS